MKIEYQIKFNAWKEDLLNRLEEHLVSKPEPGFVIEHPEKITDKLRVEVREVKDQPQTWLVFKNNIKMGAFCGSQGLAEASKYANQIINGGDKQLPAPSYYDQGSLPDACKECGGRWSHLNICSLKPKS